jgi:hypothetical protein
MLKICLFARAGESFKDYLKPLACVWQRISAILGVKKRREVASSARDDQLGVKVPVLINSKQAVPDLAFLQERPADELAQPLFETWLGR